MSLLELFCHVDAFCVRFEPWFRKHLLTANKKTRQRKRGLCLSEVDCTPVTGQSFKQVQFDCIARLFQ